MYRITCLALALALGVAAQTQVDLRSQSKSIDFSGANPTKPMTTGPALPATCGAGQMYFLTTAPAGQNIYGCVSTNTWALQAGGTGGVWGSIAGTLSSQTDLQNALNAKQGLLGFAPLNAATPVFTGTMSGPGITLTGITGLTQCLEANSSGTIIATGTPCGSGGGGGSWGSITGTLANQSDLQNALNLTEKTANKDAASGYAGLTSGSLLKIGEFPAFTGDCATSPGAVTLTCTKTSGAAFGSLATASTSGTSLLKGNGSGGVANAAANTDYLPVANPIFTGTLTGGAVSGTTAAFTGNLTTNITGSTECVHANAAGILSGTGSDCGSGGGGGYPTIQVNGTTVPGSPASINNIVTGSSPGCIVATSSDVSGVSTISLDVNSAICPTTANLQSGAALLVTETSASGTAYTGTMIPALAAYTNGMTVNWLFLTSCAGGTATTLNINTLGAKNLFQYDGVSNPAAGDCAANRIRTIKYAAALKSGAGAFVLDGGPSGGGGGVSGLTSNAIPKATSSTSIGNSSLTDNGTTVSATEPLSAPSISTGTAAPAITTGSAGVMAMGEGATPSVCAAAGVDCFYSDATQHGLLASFNNGTYLPFPQGPVATTSGHIATWNSANGGLLADGGAAVTGLVRRTCTIDVGDNSGSALADANLGPQESECVVPYAATLVEVMIRADGGTPNVIVGRERAGTVANVVASALATGSSGARACSNSGGTVSAIDNTTTCSATLQNTALNWGDWLKLVSGTAGGTAKHVIVSTMWTVN